MKKEIKIKSIKRQKKELMKEFNKPENQLPIKIWVLIMAIELLGALLVLIIAIYSILRK